MHLDTYADYLRQLEPRTESRALRKLYEQDEPPSIARKSEKRLLNMAVSQVHFKCNETWYIQKDGLTMEESLAVILANLWLKQYKTALSRDIPEMFLPEKDLNEICPESKKKVTYRVKLVQQAKSFRRYSDDIKRTVNSGPEKLLRAANFQYPNLQFTIERPNANGKLAVLDL